MKIIDSPAVRTALSIWSWLALGALVIVWTPMVAVVRLVTMPFDRGAYAAGLLFRKLAVAHQIATPIWTFQVVGNVPDDHRRPYVVVCNHESFVDILVIAHLPMEMKWLSKDQFFRFPLVGWMMRLVRDIPLRRGERESAIAALAQCRKRLDDRVSVMIFPEGTRSVTGELGPFKDGAFSTAIDAQVPILPLVVHGTRGALRKHDWRLHRATAEVHVLDPIETDGLTLDDTEALRERVRDIIAAHRAGLGNGS
jgi:1-acyl-sn-glycerol-3-phosphate acyltransferase